MLLKTIDLRWDQIISYGISNVNSIMMQYQRSCLSKEFREEVTAVKINYNTKGEFLMQMKQLSYKDAYQATFQKIKS